ncbi:quinone oxidoreductase family protein [Kutzneria kofuensis]|uniref:NADPH:quinone reductase-like Zn-dependent oxidoreductase n=1 Tax=Kutzneria kofuensis TaxID=103725 RepID=A0A7W9NIX1_9PSEU|nr:zinc-binding dehydrogenase [Kutzneria kofuensis]MBB5894009.1 NADPH:quinone reductase-like Zn-dependent oxidoreductase [Kutzneria kofuensis]
MRLVRFHAHGGPEVLQVEEAEVPAPGPGQLLLRAEAIGLNFADTKIRAGADGIFARPLPGSPTGDVVGVVDAVGPDVTSFSVGDRVAALVAEGAYADFVLADAAWAAVVPPGLDAASATALPMLAPVALRLLRMGRLTAGETVLVQSAAGGIGHLAVQLAKLSDAKVVGVVGSATKADFVRSLGADDVVTTDGEWPTGVDLVADAVGGSTLLRGIEALAPLGRAVMYGAASGEIASVNVRSLFGLRTITGFGLFAWRQSRPEEARDDVAEATRLIVGGELRVAQHASFSLTEAAQAHRVMDERANLGRVLLIP